MMGSDSDIASQMTCWHAKWNAAAVPVAILDVTVLAAKAFLPDCRQHDAAASDDMLVGGMREGTMFPHARAQALANAAPTVNVGADPTVYEGNAVTLSGTVTDSDTGDTLAHSWAQTSPADPTVQITYPTPAVAIFAVPAVPADTKITFTLTANDGTTDAADTLGDAQTWAAGGQGGGNYRRVQGGAGMGARGRVGGLPVECTR